MRFTSQDSFGRIVQGHGDGPPRTHALLVGESLVLSSPTAIEKIELVDRDSMPGGGVPTADGATITGFELPGRYRFRVHGGGSYSYMEALVCEAECMTAMPDMQRSGGATLDKRGMLASLANGAPWFTGSAASMCGHSLAPFGA